MRQRKTEEKEGGGEVRKATDDRALTGNEVFVDDQRKAKWGITGVPELRTPEIPRKASLYTAEKGTNWKHVYYGIMAIDLFTGSNNTTKRC